MAFGDGSLQASVLDERPGRREWKDIAVDEDGRTAVACDGLDISASEKSRG